MLLGQYGFTSVDEIVEQGDHIPFVRVDTISLEKDYLLKYYPEEKRLIDSDKLDVAFKQFIERKGSITHWYHYERTALRAAVLQWCKSYRVPYFWGRGDGSPVPRGK